MLFCSGFSTISLIEDRRTGKRYALKRITCHSTEDQIQARKEIDFHKRFNHPNILPLIGSDIKGQADIVHNVTSEAFLVLPYFQVENDFRNMYLCKQIESDQLSEILCYYETSKKKISLKYT